MLECCVCFISPECIISSHDLPREYIEYSLTKYWRAKARNSYNPFFAILPQDILNKYHVGGAFLGGIYFIPHPDYIFALFLGSYEFYRANIIEYPLHKNCELFLHSMYLIHSPELVKRKKERILNENKEKNTEASVEKQDSDMIHLGHYITKPELMAFLHLIYPLLETSVFRDHTTMLPLPPSDEVYEGLRAASLSIADAYPGFTPYLPHVLDLRETVTALTKDTEYEQQIFSKAHKGTHDATTLHYRTDNNILNSTFASPEDQQAFLDLKTVIETTLFGKNAHSLLDAALVIVDDSFTVYKYGDPFVTSILWYYCKLAAAQDDNDANSINNNNDTIKNGVESVYNSTLDTSIEDGDISESARLNQQKNNSSENNSLWNADLTSHRVPCLLAECFTALSDGSYGSGDVFSVIAEACSGKSYRQNENNVCAITMDSSSVFALQPKWNGAISELQDKDSTTETGVVKNARNLAFMEEFYSEPLILRSCCADVSQSTVGLALLDSRLVMMSTTFQETQKKNIYEPGLTQSLFVCSCGNIKLCCIYRDVTNNEIVENILSVVQLLGSYGVNSLLNVTIAETLEKIEEIFGKVSALINYRTRSMIFSSELLLKSETLQKITIATSTPINNGLLNCVSAQNDRPDLDDDPTALPDRIDEDPFLEAVEEVVYEKLTPVPKIKVLKYGSSLPASVLSGNPVTGLPPGNLFDRKTYDFNIQHVAIFCEETYEPWDGLKAVYNIGEDNII